MADPSWRDPSADPRAFVHGLWAGAVVVLSILVAGFVGEVGIIVWTVLVVGPAVLAFPIAWSDLAFVKPRRTTTRAIAWSYIVLPIVLVVWWLTPRAYDVATYWIDDGTALLACPLGLLVLAERAAAHRWLVWRDRLLGAVVGSTLGLALGTTVPAIVVAFALLLALLAFPLSGRSRASIALLAAVPTLGLDVFFDVTLKARITEWAVFLAYASASYAVWRFGERPRANASSAVTPT